MGDMLSQDEINALLGGVEGEGGLNGQEDEISELTCEQKDILGEIGNIGMGTAATTLSALLNRRVNITTPIVKAATWKEISDWYSRPCVGVQIGYKVGLKGANLLILANRDVKVITSLMMGGEGIGIDEDAELTELDLSAIGEAMNQMIGSSCTSLATMFGEKIDIDTPKAYQIDFSDEDFFRELLAIEPDSELVTVSFNMTVCDLIDSRIIQALPIDFAIQMAQKIGGYPDEAEDAAEVPYTPPLDEPVLELSSPTPDVPKNTAPAPAPQPEIQYKEAGAPMIQQAPPRMAPNINAQPVQFQDFDYGTISQQKENIGILMDVPLDVSVELGKTSKKIKEILEFSPGTIIELDKLAGEPIDILVNGKYVAKGEVVVIDENFAIRVTNIISPELRI